MLKIHNCRTRRGRRTPAILVGVLLIAGLRAWAAEPNLTGVEDLRIIERQVQRALPRAQQATVVVGQGGSGVIVSADGLVLSAEHVTSRPGRRVVVTLHDGRQTEAETLGGSRFADAGVLKITEPGEWPFAPMAASGADDVGTWCFALGHPSGYDEARGAVLRVGRVIVKRRNLIQTDCALIGGDSGGPLFNLAGEVIGINSRVSDELDDNYHAPVEAFQRYWEMLLAGETIPRQEGRGGGYFGVRTASHDDGVVIESVFPGSAAAAALVEPGWIITQVDRYAVASPQEFGMVISAKGPGDEVSIRYRINDEEHSIAVKLGERPRRRRAS